MTAPKTYNILNFTELISLREDVRADDHYIALSNLLIGAISDWPTINSKEPCDLLNELKTEVNAQLSLENLELFRDKLALEIEAWRIEAVTALLQMFDMAKLNGNETPGDLEEIIYDLSAHYQMLK